MKIPEGWKVDYSICKVGDTILTLRNTTCVIKEIFKEKVILSNNYGEDYEVEEWRFKCEFEDGHTQDLDPQFGSLQKIIKI
jgi:hypothetical protein